jgi:hypothetical protein
MISDPIFAMSPAATSMTYAVAPDALRRPGLVPNETVQADFSVSGAHCSRNGLSLFGLRVGGTYSESFLPPRERSYVFGGAPGCSTSCFLQ